MAFSIEVTTQYLSDRKWSLVATLGVVLMLVGLALSPYGKKHIELGLRLGYILIAVLLHFFIFSFEPSLKRCGFFAVEWQNNIANPAVSLVAIYLSTVPCLIFGVTESSLYIMPGLCVWFFGFEKVIDTVNDTNLVNLALSITVSVASTQVHNKDTGLQIGAYLCLILLPLGITFMRWLYFPKKHAPFKVQLQHEPIGNPGTDPLVLVLNDNLRTLSLELLTQEQLNQRKEQNNLENVVQVLTSDGEFLPGVYSVTDRQAITPRRYFTLVAYPVRQQTPISVITQFIRSVLNINN